MYTAVRSINSMQKIISSNSASLFYISAPQCGVCSVLKPQIERVITEQFPQIELYSIDSEKAPEISAQMSIFTVPTVLIFIDGQEFVRFSRNISISQLVEQIKRPYEMFFQ